MKTILKFNNHTYLVPASVNVNTLLKALGEMKEIQWDYKNHVHGERYVYVIKDVPEVELEIVKDEQIVTKPRLKALPEKASADCHGRDITRRGE